MDSPMRLYHYYRSSCSWRIRWALRLKEVACELVAIDLLKNEQLSASFLAKNPSGQVPCLHYQGQNFSESLAILEWLEECHPLPALLPSDRLSRMRVRQLAQVITAGTQPLQNLAVQRYHSSDREAQLSFARHWIERGLGAYETLLEGVSGSYSFGGKLTIADLCLIPQCYNALRFGVKLDSFPRIQKVYALCMSTEACRETAPERYLPAPQ